MSEKKSKKTIKKTKKNAFLDGTEKKIERRELDVAMPKW